MTDISNYAHDDGSDLYNIIKQLLEILKKWDVNKCNQILDNIEVEWIKWSHNEIKFLNAPESWNSSIPEWKFSM